MLINEIVVNEKDVPLPGTAVPIKHGKEVTLGTEKFVYDHNNNVWLRKSDGQAIPQNSEAHMVLMASQGYAPDGVAQLDPGAWKSVKGAINKIIGGPLGVASRTDPNASLLGKISGVIGDGLQRLIRGTIAKRKSNIKVGDIVQWKAEKNNKKIMQGDLVQGPVIAMPGDSYPAGIPSLDGATEVPQDNFLIKAKTGGLVFVKPIDRVQKVQG